MTSANIEESVPLSNRRETILGICISFQIIATLAVGLRLYARFKVIHSPGWDDAFVCLALVSVTIGTVFVCLSTDWGMGQHFATLSPTEVNRYLFYFYVANATYTMSATLIKLSLLVQYLRIYKEGTVRKLCIALVVYISIWGMTYSFMAWVPCFPVEAYWNWALINATCYAYGAKSKKPFSITYETHTAQNVVLDIAVLLTVMPICFRRNLTRKEGLGVAGLLSLGVWIVIFSVWRLATIVEHEAGWEPEMDFTWYGPISIILASLEVDVAILAASVPVFWPVIESSFPGIFVTREVHVTSQRCLGDNDLELENSSVRSGPESERELGWKPSAPAWEQRKDPYLGLDPLQLHDPI